jgi:hypothetical protein
MPATDRASMGFAATHRSISRTRQRPPAWTNHHQSVSPIKESREQCQEDSFNRIDAPGLGTTFDILGKLPTPKGGLT